MVELRIGPPDLEVRDKVTTEWVYKITPASHPLIVYGMPLCIEVQYNGRQNRVAEANVKIIVTLFSSGICQLLST